MQQKQFVIRSSGKTQQRIPYECSLQRSHRLRREIIVPTEICHGSLKSPQAEMHSTQDNHQQNLANAFKQSQKFEQILLNALELKEQMIQKLKYKKNYFKNRVMQLEHFVREIQQVSQNIQEPECMLPRILGEPSTRRRRNRRMGLLQSQRHIQNQIFDDNLQQENEGYSVNQIMQLNIYQTGADGITGEICPICQLEFSEDEFFTQLRCTHQYHPKCIGRWLRQNKKCPVCNQHAF